MVSVDVVEEEDSLSSEEATDAAAAAAAESGVLHLLDDVGHVIDIEEVLDGNNVDDDDDDDAIRGAGGLNAPTEAANRRIAEKNFIMLLLRNVLLFLCASITRR